MRKNFSVDMMYVSEDGKEVGSSRTSHTMSGDTLECVFAMLDPSQCQNWTLQLSTLRRSGFMVMKLVNDTVKGKLYKAIKITRL